MGTLNVSLVGFAHVVIATNLVLELLCLFGGLKLCTEESDCFERGKWQKAVVLFVREWLVLMTFLCCLFLPFALVAPLGAILLLSNPYLISSIVLMTKFLSLSEGGGASDEGFLLR